MMTPAPIPSISAPSNPHKARINSYFHLSRPLRLAHRCQISLRWRQSIRRVPRFQLHPESSSGRQEAISRPSANPVISASLRAAKVPSRRRPGPPEPSTPSVVAQSCNPPRTRAPSCRRRASPYCPIVGSRQASPSLSQTARIDYSQDDFYMPSASIILAALRDSAKRQGLTSYRIALSSGMPLTTVQRLLSIKENLPLRNIETLLKALGLDLNFTSNGSAARSSRKKRPHGHKRRH